MQMMGSSPQRVQDGSRFGRRTRAFQQMSDAGSEGTPASAPGSPGSGAFGFRRFLRAGNRETIGFTVSSLSAPPAGNASSASSASGEAAEQGGEAPLVFSCPCAQCGQLNKVSLARAALFAPHQHGHGGDGEEEAVARVRVGCTRCDSTLEVRVAPRDPQLSI